MPRPIHFEIHAGEPERAIAFYSAVFGWSFEKAPDSPMPYWFVRTGEGPGIDGGLHRRMGPKPVDGQAVTGFVCTVGVDDLDAFLEKATSAGARIALPKMAIPGIGWQVYVLDTEGNIIGLHQQDETAGTAG